MNRGNHHRRHALHLIVLLLISLLAAGCIRPTPTVEPTSTNQFINANPTPGGDSTAPTQPATIPATLDPGQGGASPDAALANAINQYFMVSTGLALPAGGGGLSFWNRVDVEPDVVVSFTFNNPSNLPCVGVAVYSLDATGNPNVFNGGYHCGTDINAPGVAAQWLLGLSGEQFVVAITGQVTGPDIASVAVEYENGESRPEPLQDGRFLVLRTDPVFAARVNVINQQGNLLGQLPVPLNPAG